MVLASGIKKMKLYSNNPSVVPAFWNADIELTITVPNGEFLFTNTTEVARKFVKENITNLCSMNKLIRASNSRWKRAIFKDNLEKALVEDKLEDRVKLSVPLYTDVLKPNITKPSNGEFRDDLDEDFFSMLGYLNDHGYPFTIHIYPHLRLRELGYPIEFGIFEGVGVNKSFSVKDGPIEDTNIFDVTYDTVISAIRRAGYNLEVMVGQVGWPTNGDDYSSPYWAQKFYDGFLRKMAKNEGTPLHHGPLEAYIYTLVDENSRTAGKSPLDRHYGIYMYDGTSKLNLDFMLKGRPKGSLVNATGITYMPKRWCIFNKSKPLDDMAKLKKQFDMACFFADCSRLAYGSSCHGLDLIGNLLYAFNNYFQSKNQEESMCDYDGNGMITHENLSQGNCEFELQILATMTNKGNNEMTKTLTGDAERLNMGFQVTIYFVPLLWIWYTLL
ncbi:hypothetical protein RJ639_024898 [Escallonia herrerae]|uniref:X8 domain-containing protein n=1 Tax=Escallonia herrerae TaxID=1293975 RepID=A0AA88UYF9_9ASTE|nr:hypothetical protein RJ639_024898 [Escallonia herrerae]